MKGSEAPSTLRRVRQPFEEVPPPAAGDTEEIDALPVLAEEAEVLNAYALVDRQ
jgi:hypothetical protein